MRRTRFLRSTVPAPLKLGEIGGETLSADPACGRPGMLGGIDAVAWRRPEASGHRAAPPAIGSSKPAGDVRVDWSMAAGRLELSGQSRGHYLIVAPGCDRGTVEGRRTGCGKSSRPRSACSTPVIRT